MAGYKLHLLDLPVDILALILQPLLTAPGASISLCPCTASPVNPLPILLVHPSLHAIGSPLFYGVANRFLLDLTGRHGRHVRRCLKEAAEEATEQGKGNNAVTRTTRNGNMQQTEWELLQQHRAMSRLLLVSPDARRRIQRLEVRIDRLRGWVHEELGPLLSDMVVHGELAEFNLAVCFDNDDGNSSKTSTSSNASLTMKRPKATISIFVRPPLAGLLTLLADPDLRTARLLVTPAHGPAWCPFHAGQGCRMFPSNDTGDDDLKEKEGGKEVWLEIDWQAILQQVDPEGRERAVGGVRGGGGGGGGGGGYGRSG